MPTPDHPAAARRHLRPGSQPGELWANRTAYSGHHGSSYLEQGTPAFIVNGWNSMGNSDTGNPFLFRDNQWLGNVNLGWMKVRTV